MTTQPGLGTGFLSLLLRDLKLGIRHRNELLNPLLFFVIVVTLFPLGITPEASILKAIGPGVIWVAALLATMLGLDHLFRSDFDDGSLEQMLLSTQPMPILVLAKMLAHWCLTGLPLVLVSPLLAVFLNIPSDLIPMLMLSLVIGTPTLSFIGAIGVGLTVGLRGGGMLLSLLVLPLYVPILIFGASIVQTAISGMNPAGQFYVLGALLVFAMTLAPLATAAALRIAVH